MDIKFNETLKEINSKSNTIEKSKSQVDIKEVRSSNYNNKKEFNRLKTLQDTVKKVKRINIPMGKTLSVISSNAIENKNRGKI